MTSGQLQRPTSGLVASYIEQFEQDEAYAAPDRALFKLFQAFPHNRNLEDVLLKVAALNGLYSTNIYAVYRVAEHIHEQDIDPRLEQRSPALVNEISLVTIGDKKRRNYSFTSKYCSCHVPDAYPIYDGFVERLIWAYQGLDHFAEFRRAELKDYPRYKETVEFFRDYYGLTQFSFKELDKFLWFYGRKIFAL